MGVLDLPKINGPFIFKVSDMTRGIFLLYLTLSFNFRAISFGFIRGKDWFPFVKRKIYLQSFAHLNRILNKYKWSPQWGSDIGITSKANETELLDDSRGNCVSDNLRNATPSLSYLSPWVTMVILSETCFSENHPGVVSTSSSLLWPQSFIRL